MLVSYRNSYVGLFFFRNVQFEMTVVSLWDVLREHGCVQSLTSSEALRFLQGKRLALDFSLDLLAQLQLSASPDLNTHAMARKLVFERVVWLLRLGAQVVGCGDGSPPDSKARTLKQRFSARHGFSGGGKENVKFLQLTREVSIVLDMLGCPSIIGENMGEGEARASALCHRGLADAVVSKDSDCLVRGITIVMMTARLLP